MSTSLRELLRGLLESLEQKKQLESLEPEIRNMLDQALDKVVEGTDSRISLVPGYRRKLSKSIFKSLQYADTLTEQIADPIDLDSSQFVTNPQLRAFFYTIDSLKETCNHSSELTDYFAEPERSDSSDTYALLCMQKMEEEILGMQLQGQHVIRDVKKTRVIFLDHHILSPAEDESIARRELKCCFFEGLVDNALASISALRVRRQQLETEQRMLSARLRSQRGGTVNKEMKKLDEINKKLYEIGYATPEVSLDLVNKVLGHPKEFVGIKNISMNLDKSGILRSTDEHSMSINKLNLSEVSINGEPPRVVTLARIKGGEFRCSSSAAI